MMTKKKKIRLILLDTVIMSIVTLIIVSNVKHRREVNVRTDTEQTRLLLAESHLADFEINEEDEIYSAVRAPWIIVENQENEATGEYVWHITASSLKVIDADSLSDVKTVVRASRKKKSASYQSNYGAKTTGTTEDVTLCYYDVATKCYIGEDVVFGKALPEKTSSTPHYTINARRLGEKVAERVKSKINPRYHEFSLYIDNGAFRAKAYAYNPTDLGIPDSVHTILPNALNEDRADYVAPKSVYIPPTVTEIGENAFRNDSILIVEHNSFAEKYAQQNGFCYRYPGSQELYGEIPESVSK